MQSYHKGQGFLPGELALEAQFPAASIFKLVTAIAAFDSTDLRPTTLIPFNGASHTLYKNNIESTQFNRWTRYASLKSAFASSINTVFGKLGLHYVGQSNLRNTSNKLGFDQKIDSDFEFETGSMPETVASRFNLAEMASGFTDEISLSPIHAALLAAAVANGGDLLAPRVVDRLTNKEGVVRYQAAPSNRVPVLSPSTLKDTRELMRATVQSGTSRKSFRQVFRKKVSDYDMGGKTGSLDSVELGGRADWFVGYLNEEHHQYGIAVVSIHKDFWTVKSSYVAAKLMQKLLSKQTVAAAKP
jgi:cell division protein FtsI/penicillin-binding protein 2